MDTKGSQVSFKLDRKDGQPTMTGAGDARFLVDPKAGDVKSFDSGRKGGKDRLYVPITLPSGKVINWPLPRNLYGVGGADVEGITLTVVAAAVTPLSGPAGAADPFTALAKAGQVDALAALYAALPGMNAKSAKAAATAAIKAAAK